MTRNSWVESYPCFKINRVKLHRDYKTASESRIRSLHGKEIYFNNCMWTIITIFRIFQTLRNVDQILIWLILINWLINWSVGSNTWKSNYNYLLFISNVIMEIYVIRGFCIRIPIPLKTLFWAVVKSRARNIHGETPVGYYTAHVTLQVKVQPIINHNKLFCMCKLAGKFISEFMWL